MIGFDPENSNRSNMLGSCKTEWSGFKYVKTQTEAICLEAVREN